MHLRFVAVVLWLCAVATAQTVDTPGGADPTWQVRFEPRTKHYAGGKFRNYEVLVVDGGDYVVDFVPYTFWTVHEIFYKGVKINQSSGATGTVIHWDGEAIGTGHRGKLRSEELHDVTLTVDGKAIPLVTDSKRVTDNDFTASGTHLTLLKKSTIGPLAHEAQFAFDPDGQWYIAEHRFTVTEPITPERFKGYRYVFMQMMPPAFSHWVRYDETGQPQWGQTAPPEPEAKPKQVLQFGGVPMRALVCFAPEPGVGVAYVYPQAYAGTNHMYDRQGKDVKFRAILFEQDTYEPGEQLMWRMRVEPFDATIESWKGAAERVVKAPWPARDE